MRYLKKFFQLFHCDKEKQSEVLKSCNFAWKESDEITFPLCMDEIEALARADKREFKSLISIFNNEKDLDKKMILSEVLVNLNYLPVKDFFMDILACKEEGFWPKFAHSKSEHLDYEFEAALNLVKMKDERGVQFLKEKISVSNETWLRWIVAELFDPDELKSITEFDLKLLLELMDICEGLGKYANREKVEKKLVQLREQKRA